MENNKDLFEKQKELQCTFLKTGAIDKAQYCKSLSRLKEKMGEEYIMYKIDKINNKHWNISGKLVDGDFGAVLCEDKVQYKYIGFTNEIRDFDGYLTFNGINTFAVTDMSNMFCNCKMKQIDTHTFDTSNVINMWGMFYKCNNLVELDLASFNTKNVTNMLLMFEGCENLEKVDITSFRTPNLKNAFGMFSFCMKLTEIDLSNLDFSNIDFNDIDIMFEGCEKMDTDVLEQFIYKKVKEKVRKHKE